MSEIDDSITNLKTRISNAYDAAEAKGATIPATKNSSNLSTCISSIELTDWASLGDELLRAEAYSKTVDTSNQFLMISNTNLYNLINASSMSAATGYKVIIDGKYYSYDNSTNTVTQLGTDSNYNYFIDGSYFYVKNNNELWYAYTSGTNSDKKVMNITAPVIAKSGIFIHDGKLYLYKYGNNSLELIDDAGIWSDLGLSCGIRDGLLYKINTSSSPTITQLSYKRVSLLDVANDNSGYIYCTFEDVPNRPCRFSTSDNQLSYGTTKSSRIVKLLSGGVCFCENGNVYPFSSDTPSKQGLSDISFNGKLSVYSDRVQLDSYESINVTNAYITTNRVHNTNFSPYLVGLRSGSQLNYLRYGTSNATKSYADVNGTDPQNTTLSGNTMTYNGMTLTRNNSKDGIFTFSPDDLRNKVWTDYEMITNAINASLHQNYH